MLKAFIDMYKGSTKVIYAFHYVKLKKKDMLSYTLRNKFYSDVDPLLQIHPQ